MAWIRLSLSSLHSYECDAAEYFSEFSQAESQSIEIDLDEFFVHYEKNQSITLLSNQHR